MKNRDEKKNRNEIIWNKLKLEKKLHSIQNLEKTSERSIIYIMKLAIKCEMKMTWKLKIDETK